MEKIFNDQFKVLLHAYRTKMRALLKKNGLYAGQDAILFVVLSQPGITQQELSDMLAVSKSTIGTSLKRMEKMGLVERKAYAQDSRCKCIFITEGGKKLADLCQQELMGFHHFIFSTFSESEIQQINLILTQLCKRIDEYDL